MNIINADKVFSKVDFQDDIDYDINPKSIYKCPFCKNELSFVMKDFRKYSFNKETVLTVEEQYKIQNFLKKREKEETNSFIDFYCPRCNVPTRIYFTVWFGGRFAFASHLEFVIIDE